MQPKVYVEPEAPAEPAGPVPVPAAAPDGEAAADVRSRLRAMITPKRAAIAAVLVGAVLLVRMGTASAPVEVTVTRVKPGRVEDTVTNSKAGTIKARRRAAISPDAGGRVVEVFHRPGESVEAGAPLVRMDDSVHIAKVAQAKQNALAAEASRREACINRDRAGRELERKRQLAREKLLPLDVIDQLETTHAALAAACQAMGAQVDRAQAEIAVAEAELGKTLIRAPFAGVLADLKVEQGEWITPAPPLMAAPALADLIDLGSLYVAAPVDEVDSQRLRVGQPARITVDSHPGEEFAGRVARIAPYVTDLEDQNRTVDVEVEFDEEALGATLRPGTSADITVVREVRENVLRVPTSALIEGRRVLVAEGEKLAPRDVTIGLRSWDFAEITAGLAGGDRFVVAADQVDTAGARIVVREAEEP
jgi:HlyD family secretion protein